MVSLLAAPISAGFVIGMAITSIVVLGIGVVVGRALGPMLPGIRGGSRRSRQFWTALLGALVTTAVVVVAFCSINAAEWLRDPFDDDREGVALTAFILLGWPALGIGTVSAAAVWRVQRSGRREIDRAEGGERP